ncbi:MAG: hypothetical protein ACOC29_00690 [Candidatus Sumerlaeota bacterium]
MKWSSAMPHPEKFIRPRQLADKIRDYVEHRLQDIVEQICPSFNMPDFVAGYRIGPNERADMAFDLAHLYRLGAKHVAGEDITTAIPRLLKGIDGPATSTFYSYRTAETLLAFGSFEDNPLLRDFTEAERKNIRQACDSTDIFDPETRTIRMPNNYWAVLARCEYARKRLGILEDESILQIALAKVQEILSANPYGFFDDHGAMEGQFDIYSFDIILFLQPLWHLLDADTIQRCKKAHTALFEKIALANGASVAWGRSVGALSVCMSLEMAVASLKENLASDPPRTLGLARNAFQQFQGWMQDGLIAAHRHRMTFQYRGPHRLLQMTLDCLGKLAWAALELSELDDNTVSTPSRRGLFPPVDDLLPFRDDNAALWMFRNEHLAFQLPLVRPGASDYQPCLHAPGLFDIPVHSDLLCGVPRFERDGELHSFTGLPVEVQKSGSALEAAWKHPDRPEESRRVRIAVENSRVHIEEEWRFADPLPTAINYMVAESEKPLHLALHANAGEIRLQSITTEGMPPFRSFWCPVQRVHEAVIQPAPHIHFTLTIEPRLKVTALPADHDYLGGLYGAMPADALDLVTLSPGRSTDDMRVDVLVPDSDILHIGWPEHLFRRWDLPGEAFFEALQAFLEELKDSPVRVVWTMHNRIPHGWDHEEGRRLYRMWAPVADAIIHHSHWGMELMRSTLPYRDDAVHIVEPHGHYGEQMLDAPTREKAAKELGLPPAKIRYGVLGRDQKEKRVEDIIEAFAKTTRDDIQLFLTAAPADMAIPDDPRIQVQHRKGWIDRATVARQVAACDALVCLQEGPSYLTSGQVADAIGKGIPMLVREWEFFREIMADAAFYCDGSVEGLAHLIEQLSQQDINKGKRAAENLQPAYTWSKLAEETLELFRKLGTAVRL